MRFLFDFGAINEELSDTPTWLIDVQRVYGCADLWPEEELKQLRLVRGEELT